MVHVLIACPKTNSVLTDEVGRLPIVNTANSDSVNKYELCKLVQRELKLNIELVYLRCGCEEKRSDQLGYVVTLLVFLTVVTDFTGINVFDKKSCHDPNEYSFVPQSAVQKIKIKPLMPSVSQYLRLYEKHGLFVHADRLFSYSLPGWFEEASKWMNERLKDAGYVVKSIRQKRQSTQGCVLRAIVDIDMNFFLKAVPRHELCDETKVTSRLADFMPRRFCFPLAIDVDRKWLLMKDYDATLSWGDCAKDERLMRKVLNDWVQIQSESASLTNKLEDAGLPKRDAEWVQKKTNEMLGDVCWMNEHWNRMSAESRQRFKDLSHYKDRYMEYVKNLCERATGYDVPLTLVHGDLNATNTVLERSGKCIYIDHGLTSISFPFIDAVSFASLCDLELSDLDFYSEHWEEYESVERLRELLKITDDLHDVFSVLTMYHLYVTAEESQRNHMSCEASNILSSVLG